MSIQMNAVITCDRCGKQRVSEAATKLKARREYTDGWGYSSFAGAVIDFCGDCRRPGRSRTHRHLFPRGRLAEALSFYREGMTFEQIASRMEVSRQRAEQMVTRAIAKLVLAADKLEELATAAESAAASDEQVAP